jgi:hypothetical protein
MMNAIGLAAGQVRPSHLSSEMVEVQ